jgi:hypothetical protein
MFPLLGRTTTAASGLPTAVSAWAESMFAQPYLASVSDPAAFVNQAFYDAAAKTLTITINGGKATTGAAGLTLANLPAGRCIVTRNGQTFDAGSRSGDSWIVTTAPLSATEDTYVIKVGVPYPVLPTGNGCGCTEGGTALALLGLVLARRRGRR